MAFNDNIIFPTDISYGSRGGPGWSTSIIEGEGGASERVARWSTARHRYNVKYGIRRIEDLNVVKDIYMVSQGPVIGFLYKDWADYTTASDHESAVTNTDVLLGTATGPSGSFQLRTKYVAGNTTVYRTITKPVPGTVVLARTPSGGGSAVNIGSFSLNASIGTVSIASGLSSGDSITAGFQFYVPVQFGAELDEELSISYDNFDSGDLPDIPLVEMTGDVVSPERFYYGGGSVITTAANFFITFAMGRSIVYAPGNTSTNVQAFLPEPSDLEPGAPYFHILNANTGSGTLTIRTFDGASIVVPAMAGGQSIPKATIIGVWSNAGTNFWFGMTN